jgi:ubiquinone/menaquinone biosynthesis C-methylase UbiE
MNSDKINIRHQADSEITPCLQSGNLSVSAQAFVSASRSLGVSPFASALRAWCVPYLFHTMENLLASGHDPIEGVNSALKSLTDFISTAEKSGFEVISGNVSPENSDEKYSEVKDITGDHYGNLFKSFSSLSYWDEPVKLLRERLERNGISVAHIQNKKTLDVGCGGGRYSVAWRLLGASPVVGLDISPINIEDANRRVKEAEVKDVSFQEGNVLELPFEDEEFDVVFSNGVLHHTTDWVTGVKELVRVLKSGGLGWIYLIENPGGIFWDVIEILRLVMKDEEKNTARAALQALKMPANRIFYMLDHVMVPINLRLTSKEIVDCLKEAGAINIQRLERGSDFDRVEHIYQKNKYAEENFGVGENRFIFSK